MGQHDIAGHLRLITRIEIVQTTHLHVQLAILHPSAVPLAGGSAALRVLDVVEIGIGGHTPLSRITHTERLAQIAVVRQTIATIHIAKPAGGIGLL